MSRNPALPAEYRRLLKEAKEALDRVAWTGADRRWLKRIKEVGERPRFVEPRAGVAMRASFMPTRQERSLVVKAWRRALPLSAAEAQKAAAGTGPLSLTLSEWIAIRADLAQSFYEYTTKRRERKLERLINKLENLVEWAFPLARREMDRE